MGATGIPVIDTSVRQLYATGYLHNHQRLWLASYIIHYRKVDWRAAAEWMYGHLMDGDLASNHLSWQWVAGTFSQKPYLFNAENVERFAPGLQSRDTQIDTSYEALEALAMRQASLPAENVRPLPCREPALLNRPEFQSAGADLQLLTRNRHVALIHPWSLGRRPNADCVIGIIHLPFHKRFPWSAKRWDFVMSRMRLLCDVLHVGDLEHADRWLKTVASVQCQRTANPGYAHCLSQAGVAMIDPPQAFPDPGIPCASFSVWLRAVSQRAPGLFQSSLAEQIARQKHGLD